MGVFGKIDNLIFFKKNTQNCFAYSLATKYHPEAVLFSKRTEGYPLSPHIKTIEVDFYKLSNKAKKMGNFEEEKIGRTVRTLEYV